MAVQTLRFKQRHVHQTIVEFVKGALVDLKWGDASLDSADPANVGVNFGTAPATYMEVTPDEDAKVVNPNTIAISMGDEPANVLEQLGGGLFSVTYPLYVDVYGANQGISLSIAGDVKDLLYEKAIPVYDFTNGPMQVAGAYIEFENVRGPERPPNSQLAAAESFRRYWRMMQADALTYFSESP